MVITPQFITIITKFQIKAFSQNQAHEPLTKIKHTIKTVRTSNYKKLLKTLLA